VNPSKQSVIYKQLLYNSNAPAVDNSAKRASLSRPSALTLMQHIVQDLRTTV